MKRDLLSEVREFLQEVPISPTYLGKLVTGNSEVVSRLESGRTVTLLTAEKLRAFMAERRKQHRAQERAKERAAKRDAARARKRPRKSAA